MGRAYRLRSTRDTSLISDLLYIRNSRCWCNALIIKLFAYCKLVSMNSLLMMGCLYQFVPPWQSMLSQIWTSMQDTRKARRLIVRMCDESIFVYKHCVSLEHWEIWLLYILLQSRSRRCNTKFDLKFLNFKGSCSMNGAWQFCTCVQSCVFK